MTPGAQTTGNIAVYGSALALLSLRPGTEISCAGSNNDLCTVNAVVRLHQQPQEF